MSEDQDGATVAIIPARGGSKRIPDKNIRPFLGVPLIARTIRSLRATGLFDRIVVSTDDDEIGRIAEEAGGDVPFRRPAELADDHAPTRPVITHAIEHLRASEPTTPIQWVCTVLATAVFITGDDLGAALDLLRDEQADIVFATTTFEYPIQRALRRLPDGSSEMIWPEHRYTRSQDLEETYHDAGQFYWGEPEAWLGDPDRPLRRLMYVMPRWRTLDIDTEEDWQMAEAMVRAYEHDDER